VENPTGDTMILSSFEDAVKTYDLTWRIREASEESTRELHGATLATAAGDSTVASTESSKESVMESVQEGVEKLGLSSTK
jgi:hypothetical protein